jgi:hypothetical protein
MKKNFIGIDGTVELSYLGKYNKEVGIEQEIKKIKEGEQVDFELRFKVPFESTSKAYMITEVIRQ